MSFIESKKKRPGSFRHIWPNLGRYRIWTLAAAIFGGLEVMLEVLIPMLMSVIVDGGLYREQDFMLRELFPEALIANRDRFVLTVGIIMVIVACCSMACGILSARCSAVASQGFAKNLRANLLGKIQDFSFANTDHFTTSSLITRATTDVNTVRNTMQQFLRTLIRSPFMVLMATVMAFTISPHLAVIFLISIPFLAGVLAILMKIGQPRFRKMLQKMDSMNRAVQENLISSRVVKAYVRGDYESERFRGTAEDLRQATLSSSRLFTLTDSQGKKMGKTAGNAVWLDPNKTSPFEFYQYWRNVGDADVMKCIRMLTFLPLEQIDEMSTWQDQRLNEAKEILAYEMTSMVHGKEEAEKAQNAARALFSGNAMDTEHMPSTQLTEADLTDGAIGILTLMVKAGLAASNGEARRLVVQGGVLADGEKVAAPTVSFTAEQLAKGIVIKKGKKIYHKVTL